MGWGCIWAGAVWGGGSMGWSEWGGSEWGAQGSVWGVVWGWRVYMESGVYMG